MSRKTKKGSAGGPPELAPPTPATAAAPAPPPSTPSPFSVFSPASSYSKCVLLFDWWLVKREADSGGKRLAVGGLTTPGNQAMRVFTSAPIVKRLDAYTLETSDGITVRIQGLINKARTHDNGIPPEVSRLFLIGFPFTWELFADGDFRKEHNPLVTPTSASGADEQSEHPSHGEGGRLGTSFGGFLAFFTSAAKTSSSDVLRSVASVLGRSSDCSSGDAKMQSILEASVTDASPQAHPSVVEEVDASGQYHVNDAPFARSISSAKTRNVRGIAEEASCSGNGSVNGSIQMGHDTSFNTDCRQHEKGQCMQSKALLQKGVELEKDGNLTVRYACQKNDKEGNVYDNYHLSSIGLVAEGVSSCLSPKDHLQQCQKLNNDAAEFQNPAEVTRRWDGGAAEDLAKREESVGKDFNSLTGKMSLPVFELPLRGPLGSTHNGGTPKSAVSTGSFGSSPDLHRLLQLAHERKQQGHALRSQNCAESIEEHSPNLHSSATKPLELSATKLLQSCIASAPVATENASTEGFDQSENANNLRKRTHSDEASGITRKRTKGLPNNQAGNHSKCLTEAQHSKYETLRRSTRKTVWRPSLLQDESPLTRGKAKRSNITSPEVLNFKRSKSGRLLVPQISKWCQDIIYDMDGSVTGITNIHVPNSPFRDANGSVKMKGHPNNATTPESGLEASQRKKESRPRKCGNCGEVGHYKKRCSMPKIDQR